MRVSIMLLLLVAGAFSAGAAVSIDAPVSNVTVYPDRAVVTRSGTVELPAGVSEIRFPNLPDGLLDESLQISGGSPGALEILDVRVARSYREVTEPVRLQPLLEERDRLEKEIAEIDLDLELLQQQRAFLTKAEDSVTSPRGEGELPPPGQWRELMSFFHESLSELLHQMHAQASVREKLNGLLEALNAEIAQTRPGEPGRVKETIVRVQADNPTAEAAFSLSYVVRNAGWNPAYNVRVDSPERTIRLDYEALVRQRTGEDWEGIQLALSTARPALGASPPELQQWVIDVHRPSQRPAATAVPARDLAYRFESGSVPEEVARFRSADVEAGLTAVLLRVPGEVSIPADGQPHRTGIQSLDLDGDFRYTIVPKLSNHAYLQARVTHSGTAPVLPGRANIFLGGNLAGHVSLPRVDPGEEFELPLGVDEAIGVERNLLRRFVERRGILSRTTRTRFEFETEITNQRATAAKVEIEDHVPVSRHERIEVNLIELSGGVADESRPGVHTWKKTLEPGETVKIPLVFSVEHPEDMDVTGL